MPTSATKKLASELSGLATAAELTPAGRKALTDALASKQPALVMQAAKLLESRAYPGCASALQAAFRELTAKHDPGAVAKAAIVAALDAVEDDSAEFFYEAAQYVQVERNKRAEHDTAASVRARAILALARVGHADLTTVLGAALGDPDPTVRLSAARTITHRRAREAAGLLLLRLGAGEEVPEVASECLHALFATAPDFAVRQAEALLRQPSVEVRERTVHALGSAPHDAAAALLIAQLEAHALAEEREPLIRALGLSLRPKARAQLLDLLDSERSSDAEAALSALAIHRYDARLAAEVRERTAHSRELTRRALALFAADS